MDGLICRHSCERRSIVGSGDAGMRRSRIRELEQALLDAPSPAAKALAPFRLAVFHDNNGREVGAIPHYRAAMRLGLRGIHSARAHMWLASSVEGIRHRRLFIQTESEIRGSQSAL